MHIESVIGAIFSPKRDQILLIKRSDVPVWVLPGGGVESNESPSCAIIREIVEETGFTVKVDRFVGLYTPINRLAKITHLYECSIVAGSPQLSEETRNVQFFSLGDLPKEIPPPFREWIEDAYQVKEPVCKELRSVNYRVLFLHLCRHPLLVLRFLLARMGVPINSR